MFPGEEIPAVLFPRFSMLGPFKGHRSMKSTPLFPGSSCSISTQFLLQDHMAAHYRNLSTAKAAVDSSAPKSLSSSVKYRDQQNKERLLQAFEKMKKELQQIHSPSHHHSLRSFIEQGKVPNNFRETQTRQWKAPSPVTSVRGNLQRTEQEIRYYREGLLSAERSKTRPYKDPQKQTYGGDLLERHSASFTKANNSFKPRLLKKSGSSFLSKYRYYNKAPPKKKSIRKHPETRSTEDSFPEDSYQPLENVTRLPQTMEDNYEQSHSRLLQQADDLKCLHFLKEVTEDIILRGGSSSVIDHVFQDHLHRKRHDIPEVKKKILMRELKEELEKPEKLDFSISYVGALYGPEDFFTRRYFSF